MQSLRYWNTSKIQWFMHAYEHAYEYRAFF